MNNEIYLKRKHIGICFGILLILIIGCISSFPISFTTQAPQEPTHAIINVTEQINVTVKVIDPMPVSEHIREYNMTKMGGIYRAINGSSYIDPDHEVVQWYARNTMFNESGLFYLNGKKVFHNHQSDFDCENGDYWLNADYYLSQGFYGDCEDHAIAMASILEAKDISNMIVCISNRKGWNHVYVEYHYEGEYYILNSMKPMYGVRTDDLYENHYKAWMFNIDNSYTTYNKDWAEDL